MVLDVFCFVLFSVEHFVVNPFFLPDYCDGYAFFSNQIVFLHIERHRRCSCKKGIVHSLSYYK